MTIYHDRDILELALREARNKIDWIKVAEIEKSLEPIYKTIMEIEKEARIF